MAATKKTKSSSNATKADRSATPEQASPWKARTKPVAAREAARGTTSPKASTNGATKAKKATAPVKLTERQSEFLRKIHDAGDAGYEVGPKLEQRTVDALVDRKLAKRGPKNKESGKYRYLLTKAGMKHLPAPAPGPAPPAPTPAHAESEPTPAPSA